MFYKQDSSCRSFIPRVDSLYLDMAAANIARQDGRGRWADFHSFRYFFCTQMAAIYPIQKVKALMRHCSINQTADLYLDLGLTDVAEDCWFLEPLFPPGFAEARTQPMLADASRVGADVGAIEMGKGMLKENLTQTA